MMDEALLLRNTVQGDGSYITFEECATIWPGTDYEATNKISGTFTSSISSDETEITIVDQTQDGGNYNGTWTIYKFTGGKLDLSRDRPHVWCNEI